jgi:thioredoxin 1
MQAQQRAGKSEEKEPPPTPSVRFIELGAEWCGPCQSMKPIIEELKKQYRGKVEFVAIDIDKNKDAAQKYNVSAIPVQLIFQNAKQVFRHTGSISKADIVEQFKKLGVTPN